MTLSSDLGSVAAARAFTRESVCVPHQASAVHDAQLLVSELVTNCVRYGSPPIVLHIICDETAGLQVRVRDASPAPPELVAATPDAENGRGMMLVDHISSDWGIEPTDDGKVVWFRLAGT